jgi:hypothetical protein
MKTYTGSRNMFGTLSQNSSVANLALGDSLIMDSLRYLTTKFFFNEATYIIPGGTIAGTQTYQIPFNMKQYETFTITVGNIRYLVTEVPNRAFWDKLNTVPYSSDIPQYAFRYQNTLSVFPIPASSGNVMTFNFKRRIKDLSIADYVTGTVTVANGSASVTGSGTTWTNLVNANDLWFQCAGPLGDNEWYQISGISGTTITLYNQYQGVSGSGLSYTIGETSLLPEDYQDLPIYRALQVYFTTRVVDLKRAQSFQELYDIGFEKLSGEFGSKTYSVAISAGIDGVENPNLFLLQGQ